MKKKIIGKIINHKISTWIDSIDDENVKCLCKKNTIVTGGCIPSMFLKEKISDYDVYFRDKETVKAVAKYYISFFKEKGEGLAVKDLAVKDEEGGRVKIFIRPSGVLRKAPKKDEKFTPIIITSNAITLSDKIQLVIRFYGEPRNIHKNYDFVHCTNYWDIQDKKVVVSIESLESIITKQLHYAGSLYPVCSMFRIRKFIKRGWHISGGEMLKIAFQIAALNLQDIKVLEDQLVGVDTSYFSTMIRAIKKRQELEGDSFKIDNLYLTKLVEEVF